MAVLNVLLRKLLGLGFPYYLPFFLGVGDLLGVFGLQAILLLL